MKFLVDDALSPNLANALSTQGHDAVHVRDLGLASAVDTVIFELARAKGRVLVSADTDFGTLLALRGSSAPSLILFRRGPGRDPIQQYRLITANLPFIEQPLLSGCIVVFEDARLRIRSLPLRDPT